MSSITVALDARNIFRKFRRGTGKNLIDLYRHLAALKSGWRFLMFHRPQTSDNPFDDLHNVKPVAVDIRGDRFNLWQQVRFPMACRMSKSDIIHSPANTGPKFPLTPMILTIHDLIPVDFAGSEKEVRKWANNVRSAARSAIRIITPSHYTKDRVVKSFGVKADKIIVNYWAPDSGCRQVTDRDELDRVGDKYGAGGSGGYVLGFGSTEYRKNTSRLLRAWAQVSKTIRKEYVLLVIGIDDRQGLKMFENQAEELGIIDDCRLRGFAGEGDMSALISGASMLCYPSLSEGFGLPVLDAFACGTPVLTSNTTSLPEVAGQAAVLVDPQSENDIADGIERILMDDSLADELVDKGKRRLEMFTWDKCAGRVGEIFEQVAQEG